MTDPNELILIDKLAGLERAYHGLTLALAAAFDERLADTRHYVADQIAKVILSDELEAEIDGITNSGTRGIAGQTVNEICCDVFGSDDWQCGWREHRQWLGDAIVAASLA